MKDSFYKLVEGIDTRFKSAVSNTKSFQKSHTLMRLRDGSRVYIRGIYNEISVIKI